MSKLPVSAHSKTFVFIDGHVHIYACHDTEKVFDGAWKHFRDVASRYRVTDDFQAALIFTEAAGDRVFAELAKSTGGTIGRWRVSATDEASSLILRRDDSACLIVVAGRQLVSAEKLELSAYFVTEPLAEGAPLATLLKEVGLAGGVPVLPWGVGKWLGKRGQQVEQGLLHSEVPLMVSDNGGRPWFWPMPRLFRIAHQQGIPVLAGSDALPRVSEEQRAGSFGFVLRGALSLESPSQDLKNRLLSLERSPARYGQREGVWNFFRNQFGMQLQRIR